MENNTVTYISPQVSYLPKFWFSSYRPIEVIEVFSANQIAGIFKVWSLSKEVKGQVNFLHVVKDQSFL